MVGERGARRSCYGLLAEAKSACTGSVVPLFYQQAAHRHSNHRIFTDWEAEAGGKRGVPTFPLVAERHFGRRSPRGRHSPSKTGDYRAGGPARKNQHPRNPGASRPRLWPLAWTGVGAGVGARRERVRISPPARRGRAPLRANAACDAQAGELPALGDMGEGGAGARGWGVGGSERGYAVVCECGGAGLCECAGEPVRVGAGTGTGRGKSGALPGPVGLQ